MYEQMDSDKKTHVKDKIHVIPNWSYATRKSVAKNFLNVSLLFSNAVQLKTLYENKTKRDALWTGEVILIIVSIVLQVLVSVLLFVLSLLKPTKEHHLLAAQRLNNVVVVLVILTSVINIIISSCDIHSTSNADD